MNNVSIIKFGFLRGRREIRGTTPPNVFTVKVRKCFLKTSGMRWVGGQGNYVMEENKYEEN